LEQIQLGIVPLPNLSLLPRRYHHYYPTIFNGNGKERTDPRLGELIEAHARGDSTKARALDAELFTVQSSYQIDSLQSDNIPSISEAPAINPDIDNNDQDKFDGNDSGIPI
jgi:hypothetical protein